MYLLEKFYSTIKKYIQTDIKLILNNKGGGTFAKKQSDNGSEEKEEKWED